MDQNRFYVSGNILCKGIQQATSRSEEPVLCLIRGDAITFVAVSGLAHGAFVENQSPQACAEQPGFRHPSPDRRVAVV